MMMRTLKSLLLMGSATLLVACGTATTTNAPTNTNMDKNFTAILKTERAADEVAYLYHISNIQKEYDDVMTLHNQFIGKRLNESQMNQIEAQAEELIRAIDTFSTLAPGSKVHRKSEESLFNVLTLMKKLAKETVAVANTNGIDTLGGLDGTVTDLTRPLKVLYAKWDEEWTKSHLPNNDQLIDVFFQESEIPIPEDKEEKPVQEPKKESEASVQEENQTDKE